MASNIVLADAQGTPVNHTFTPRGPNAEGVFRFVDSSATNAIGFWTISAQLKSPPLAAAGASSAQRVYRASIGLHEPIQETVSNNTVSGIAPAPTVSYVPRAFVEFVMPERASLENRQTLRKMIYNLLAESQMVSMVESLINPY